MKIKITLKFSGGTGEPLPETSVTVDAPKGAVYVAPEVTIIPEVAVNAEAQSP